MDSITLTLSNDEVQQLLQLIDIAVRGSGLQHARQAVALIDLLAAASAKSSSKGIPNES